MVLRARSEDRGPIFEGYTSPTVDSPQFETLTFAQVPLAPLWFELAIAGVTVGLLAASDANAEIEIAIEEPTRFVRIGQGGYLPPHPRPFSKVYLRRPSYVPSDAGRNYLIGYSYEKELRDSPIPTRVQGAGADNWLPTVVARGAAVVSVPTRSARRLVKIMNTDNQDGLIGPTVGLCVKPLRAGQDTLWFPYTGAIATANASMLIEEIF